MQHLLGTLKSASCIHVKELVISAIGAVCKYFFQLTIFKYLTPADPSKLAYAVHLKTNKGSISRLPYWMLKLKINYTFFVSTKR